MPPAKPKDSSRRRKYTDEDMHRAILAVRAGEPVAAAARQFGVPRVTLMDKIAGRTSECCKMGRKPVVGNDEELILVRWILDCRAAGFPISTDQLIYSTQKMMEKLGKLQVFQKGVPTKRWVEGFLKRHPQLSLRECQTLTTSRANVTLANVHNWFKEVRSYLEKNDLLNILKNPSRVYNCDETAFFLCPDKGKVIVGRGDKSVYRVSGNSEKDNVTVLLNCSADGSLAPPMVVFPYDRWPPKVIASIPEEWGAGKTENGWMTAQSFFEYIGNVFEPYLTEQGIERPVILFMDGHTSHMSLEVSELCSKKKIILVALYPNATHLLQPLDVAVFHPLKAAWRRAVTKWRFDNGGRKLKNEDFAPLAKEVLDSGAVKPETIKNGFKTCGLLSLDPKSANLTKLIGEKTATKAATSTNMLTLQRHLYFLESRIEPAVLTSFQNEEDVSVEDRSLFKVWKGIATEISNLRNATNPVEATEEAGLETVTQPEPTEELDDPITAEEYQPNENQQEVNFEVEPIVVTIPPSSDQTFSSMSFEVDFSLNDSIFREASENFMNADNVISLPSCSWDTPIFTPTKEIDDLLEHQNINSSTPASKEFLIPTSTPNITTPYENPNIIPEDTFTTDITKMTNTPKNSSDPKIPSPFKQCLMWPDPKQKSEDSKRKKIMTPSVVTSKVWQDYHRKIKEEKAKKELELAERKKMREEKMKIKQEKIGNKVKRKLQEDFKKSSKKAKDDHDEEDDVADESEIDENVMQFDLEKCCEEPKNPDTFKIGMWVVVPYSQKKGGCKKFVGQILSLDDENIEVKFLVEKGGKFVWPNNDDIDTVTKEDIVTTLEEPIFDRRGYLTFSYN